MCVCTFILLGDLSPLPHPDAPDAFRAHLVAVVATSEIEEAPGSA